MCRRNDEGGGVNLAHQSVTENIGSPASCNCSTRTTGVDMKSSSNVGTRRLNKTDQQVREAAVPQARHARNLTSCDRQVGEVAAAPGGVCAA